MTEWRFPWMLTKSTHSTFPFLSLSPLLVKFSWETMHLSWTFLWCHSSDSGLTQFLSYSKLLGSFWHLFGFLSGMSHLTLVWSKLSSHPNYLDLVDSVWCFFGPFYKYAPRVDFLLVWLVWLWLTRVIHSSKLLAPLACHLLSCNTATNTFYNLGKYILQF